VGRLSGSLGLHACGGFLGSGCEIQGVRYAGSFALIGNEEHTQARQNNIAGLDINVRYDPADTIVSVIVDRFDPPFEGLAARQNPEWLGQAPELQTLNLTQK
jgi:hypothetical protein